MRSDREHIQRCLDGNPNDLRFLVERYQGAVYAYAITRVGDRGRAREITEETFVRAYFALEKLRDHAAFHSWLLGITSRVAREFRRQGRDHGSEFCEISVEPTEPMCDDGTLDEAIAGLPEAQRQVVLLRFFRQQSCREIATELGVPVGTVTKTLSRAYEGLRAALGVLNETAEKLEKPI